MTKQEIREGLGTWLSYFKEDKQGLTVDDGVNWILGFLHSQGVVLKVDRELPLQVACDKCHEIFTLSNEGLSNAGYEAVESLIKERE